MGNCCFQNEHQSYDVEQKKDPEEEKKNFCFVVGNVFAGKSTFRKRAKMLANMLLGDGAIDDLTSQDKSMYQLTTIATIMNALHILTTMASTHGIVTDDVIIKHTINAMKTKAKLHGKIATDKKLTSTDAHGIDNYDLLSFAMQTESDDHNHDHNYKQSESKINHLIKPFEIPEKIEQCFEKIQAPHNDSLYNNIVWHEGDDFLSNLQSIFDNDTIDAFINFFQTKEFQLMLNNYDNKIYGGGMSINPILEINHFKNLVTNGTNYVSNYIDCLCSRQRTTGLVKVQICHDNEEYFIIDVGGSRGGGSRGRGIRTIFYLSKVLVFVMDLSGIERPIWEDANEFDTIDSLEHLCDIVKHCHKAFKRLLVKEREKLQAQATEVGIGNDHEKDSDNAAIASDKKSNMNDMNDVSDMSDQDSVQILVLLNKYKAFENYVSNNVNCNSINCLHVIDWTPSCHDNDENKQEHDIIVEKYQQSKEMKYFRNKIWLNCQEIIQLITLKIQIIFECYQRYDAQFEQNVLVCDLLDDCDTIENDVNKIQAPLKQMNQSLLFFEKILRIWIDQQGMENVLTKDLINIILIYCKDYQVVQFAQIFARIKQLCTQHDLIQDSRVKL